LEQKSKKYGWLSLILSFGIGVLGAALYGQTPPDSIQLKFPITNPEDPTANTQQSFDLGDPSGVEKTIVFDPITGKYIFKEKFGDLDFRPPSMMTLEEFIEYERRKKMQDYWREKIDTQSEEGQGIFPPIKIDNPGFAQIFGSDEINIRPEGMVEVSLGVNQARYENPMLPENQRRITRFDFDQQIRLNLVGQIGDKMKLGTNYDTQAAFDFDNVTKLEWTGEEDQILQKIEAGNVAMPLQTSLIEGSQTLFGLKTRMRFGRLTVDAIASTSRGQKQEVNIQGGAQIQQFELKADNYEANRHFFLNYYHRENYDGAMETVPFVNSLVDITRIEVWLTNMTNNVEDTRNILAFTDLGEPNENNWSGNPGGPSGNPYPNNNSNNLYNFISNNPQVRGFNNAVVALNAMQASPGPFRQALEYEKVENARRLTEQEFTYNAQLGFISVNMPLNNDEVLAVAYEYTVSGRTYQVGEFSTDGIVGQDALFLKLLKPTILNPRNKLWDLMMKNVYSIGAYQLDQDGFRLDILYNNPDNSLLVNFLPYPGMDDKQILDVVGMDRLNQNNRPQRDGVFDFKPIRYEGNKAVNAGTVNTRNGRVYFSTIEPFGQTLRKELEDAGLNPLIINTIVFQELYDSTRIAAQQIPQKNRFYFKGQYKSSISSDIPLPTLNVPEGSVVVTAGGIRLTEGSDFTVDYNLGRVKILNSAILESNADIKVSVESNSVFGFQNKTFLGTHLNYMINPDFNIGATWLRKTERPITQKVDIGDEPFRNNIIGMDVSYRTDLPFLTKLINYIPTISTKQMSTLVLNAEAAHLIPGAPRAISRRGISYVDDFEGSQSTIDLRNFVQWKLASIPQGQTDLFPEAILKNNLAAGFNRAHLSWYTIDPLFYMNNALTPQNIAENPELSEDVNVALVNQTDLFPNLNPALGTITNIPVLNMTYYPRDRGMYNYDTTNTVDSDGKFTNPQDRWAGIMRAITTTDFEQTNVEYIQFWMLDPFNQDQEIGAGGDLYFNLGNLSEDILPDSRKSFENGLPIDPNETENIDFTNWARVSTQQVVVNAFDNNPATRALQDVGLDGYDDAAERSAFTNYVNWINSSPILSADARARLLSDISSDNYHYYRGDDYDAQGLNIIERYKFWNNHEGNSPTPEMDALINAAGYPTQATNMPDMEDINMDNNLSETEAYFQYRVSLRQNDLQVGRNYIINTREYAKGEKVFRWYQFRIPVLAPDRVVNGITDFRSIRFMRIFMKGFTEQTTLRFAKLEFIRGEWRRFFESLEAPTDGVQIDPDLTDFNIGAVNVEEHDQREPINYVIPPGILREVDPSQAFQRQLNEQAMTLEVCNLRDGDARAATRIVGMDMIMYENLEMFIHAEEKDPTDPLFDNDLTVFVRLGTDFRENYYEYEVPLKVTPWGATSDLDIWPEENNMRIVFKELLDVKKERNALAENPNSNVAFNLEYVKDVPHQPGASDNNNVNHPLRRIKVRGNPNLADVKTIMIGVRNPAQNDNHPWKPDDGLAKCAEIWVNELRLTDFQNEGGSAALARAQIQVADFANVQLSGAYSGVNWGSIDSRVAERQRDTRYSFDVSANAQLGQLLGEKLKIDVPFLYTYSVGIITPQFDPFNPDIKISDYEDAAERRRRAQEGQAYNHRKSFNFTNVRKQRSPGSKARPWDVSNLNFNYGHSEDMFRDFNTTYDRTRIWKGGVNYIYTGSPKLIEPFKNNKFMKKSKWWDLPRDANLYLGPKSVNVNNNLIRNYNERQIRNNIPNTDFEFQPIYLKNFVWNRNYIVKYDITKNLKFDVLSNNMSIFDEAEGQVDRRENPELFQEFMDSIRTQMRTLGRVMRYDHTFNMAYNVPLNKIPALNWVNTNIRYQGGYEWSRPNLGLEAFGNQMQNSRNVNVTSQFNMANLYKKSELLQSIMNDGRGAQRATARRSVGGGPQRGGRQITQKKEPDTRLAKKMKKWKDKLKELEKVNVEKLEPDEKVEHEKQVQKWERKIEKKEPRYEKQVERLEKKEERKKENIEKFGKPYHPVTGFFGRLLMSLRTVSTTYALTDGMVLPGFTEEAQIGGLNRRTIGDANMRGFVAGSQQRDLFGRNTGFEFAPHVANQGWIVDTSSLNAQHTVMHAQNIGVRASLEPFKDLKVDITMTRNFMDNSSEFYRFNDSIQSFESQSRFRTTNLTYTTISIRSAFETLDQSYRSATFDAMRAARVEVSELLAAGHPESFIDSGGFYNGYGAAQQDVIVGAFLATFKGQGINESSVNPLRSIPLPNWQISYNGLSKFESMKKYVQNFTLRHGYMSTVTISGMQTNLNATQDEDGFLTARDINNNFIPMQQIQNITIAERFSPLVGFDATWKIKGNGLITKFEYNQDRAASLSLANNQVTEMLGTEIVVGMGYKFSNVKLPIQVQGAPLKPSDLNVRIDLSIRDNLTVIRKIVENTNQATAGQRVFSIRSSADYLLNQNFTVSLYFDQMLTDPKVAISYPTGNTAAGVRLRFNLGGLQ
jgi:cell surface protein SprA